MSDLHVLLVDDEEDYLSALGERLSARGVTVDTATTAAVAIEKMNNQNYDAVVLDMMMPGMDGIETLKVIKDQSPEQQVILLTGHPSVNKGISAMKLGALDFLVKPAELSDLMACLQAAKDQKMMLVQKRNQQRIQDILTSKAW